MSQVAFCGSVKLTQSSELLLTKETVAGDQQGRHGAEVYSNKLKFHTPTRAVGVVCSCVIYLHIRLRCGAV